MDLNLILVCVVIVVALFFSYTNGFHDAANAIATSVSTRAWTPRAALLMAATMNVIGAMMGTAVAKTVGKGIISISDYAESPLPEMQQKGLVIILAALLGACIWNLITWWFGLPSSSSHALIGGMVGAGLLSGTMVHWWGIMSHVVIPMFASPIIGFVIGYFVMKLVLWLLRNAQYHRTMRRFRAAQRFSSAAMALGHGIQDAQKTMGIIVMALLAGGYGETHNILDPITGEMNVPLWVKISGALAISLGTMAGGGRIMRTIGRKIIDLDPARGFTAEAVSASILYLCSYVIHAPISTTQVVSTAIMGVGCTKRFSAVRWGVAGNIVIAWFLTLPAAALVSGVSRPCCPAHRVLGHLRHAHAGRPVHPPARREDRDYGRDDQLHQRARRRGLLHDIRRRRGLPRRGCTQQRGREGMHFQLQGLRGVALRNLDAGCDVDASDERLVGAK